MSDITYGIKLESARFKPDNVPAWRWHQYFKEVFDALRVYEGAEHEGRLVEVVRCGECKHAAYEWSRSNQNTETAFCQIHEMGVLQTDFCSYGETRAADKAGEGSGISELKKCPDAPDDVKAIYGVRMMNKKLIKEARELSALIILL